MLYVLTDCHSYDCEWHENSGTQITSDMHGYEIINYYSETGA